MEVEINVTPSYLLQSARNFRSGITFPPQRMGTGLLHILKGTADARAWSSVSVLIFHTCGLCTCFQLLPLCFSFRFVSDYGPEGYNCVCQHRLLQALQRLNVGPEYVRTYPPCLLEWTANRKRAHTVLHIHCLDGEKTHIDKEEIVANLIIKKF